MAVLNFPDPTSQTPANTFSPTSTPNATSNGVTYVWTNGSWSIAGVSNGGFLDKDEADSYYVEQSGDNMTGDLTLGTDKITLDATGGSATFAGNVDIGAPLDFNSEGVVRINSSTRNTDDVYGEVAVYADRGVLTASDIPPAYRVRTRNAANNGWENHAAIWWDGRAEFAGNVRIEGGITAAGSQISEFFGTQSDSTTAFEIRDNSGANYYYTVTTDGSVWIGNKTGTGGNYSTSNNANIQLKADGSATFAGGTVLFGDDSSDLGGYTFDGISNNGFRLYYGINEGELLFSSVKTGATQIAKFGANFQILANGTAGFRNAIFNLEPDNDANYVTTTDAEGNESRVYNGPTLDVKERLQTKTAALEAIKTAAQDASITTLADFKAAIATALANI